MWSQHSSKLNIYIYLGVVGNRYVERLLVKNGHQKLTWSMINVLYIINIGLCAQIILIILERTINVSSRWSYLQLKMHVNPWHHERLGFFFRHMASRPMPKHLRQLTTWQVFRQVERRIHTQESNRQPLPWDLGISPPSYGSLGSSRTVRGPFWTWD